MSTSTAALLTRTSPDCDGSCKKRWGPMPRSSSPLQKLVTATSAKPVPQHNSRPNCPERQARLALLAVHGRRIQMQHGKIYDNITELIGNTPMVRLRKVTSGGAGVVVK